MGDFTKSHDRGARRQRVRAFVRHLIGATLVTLLINLPAVAQQDAAPPTAERAVSASAAGLVEQARPPAPEPLTHRGTGEFTTPPPAPPAPPQVAPDTPRIDVVFDHAPVAVVVQSLLTDFAHASVVVDPRVTGDVTIRSMGQLTAEEIPEFLRSSLSAMNLELIEQSPNAYLLRPALTTAEGAPAEVVWPGAQTRSGLVIYGLRYVSAAEMQRMIQPLTRQGVTVRGDRNREMLILSGVPAWSVSSCA